MTTPMTPNFHYEQRRLENDLVTLEIFHPSKHAARFVDLVQNHPEVFTYVAFPVLASVDDFLTQIYNPIASSLADCLYAIVDKKTTSEDNLAGVLSFNDTSKTDAATELGVVVFPMFQRTHNGLGLRRVAWQTNANNAASRRIALRMGFDLEGILRWQRAFVPNRACQEAAGVSAAALSTRNGANVEDEVPGRHTAVFSVVWDDWETKRPVVLAQMKLRG